MSGYLFSSQKQFYDHDSSRKFFLGGRQSGKTTALGYCAAKRASKRNCSVEWMAPKKRMAQSAHDVILNIVKDSPNEFPTDLEKVNENQLVFKSGGDIFFRSSQSYDSQYISCDLLVLDESLGMKNMRLAVEKSDNIIASGTPERGLDRLDFYIDKGFKIMPVPTSRNPLVDLQERDRDQNHMSRDKFRRTYLIGTPVGDHLLWKGNGEDERVYECMLCEFAETVFTAEEPEKMALAEQWVFGKALDCGCV